MYKKQLSRCLIFNIISQLVKKEMHEDFFFHFNIACVRVKNNIQNENFSNLSLPRFSPTLTLSFF